MKHEKETPSKEENADRWTIDHLFLDQDAIPTVVEVKRGDNTGARREAIGEILDYAANALLCRSAEVLREHFKITCGEPCSPDDVLTEFLGPDADVEQFWQQVKKNLQAGRIRLVFVADEIPLEMKRVVEFLNSQMALAEVLAVELKQYAGQGLKTLVPRLIGQTASGHQKKSIDDIGTKQWEETSFLADLLSRRGPDETAVAQAVLHWAGNQGLRIWWGKGREDGSFFPMIDHKGETFWTISVWTHGRLEIQFHMMQTKPPFDEEPRRLDLLARLNELPWVSISPDAVTKRPSIPLEVLTDTKTRARLIEILDWICEQVRTV